MQDSSGACLSRELHANRAETLFNMSVTSRLLRPTNHKRSGEEVKCVCIADDKHVTVFPRSDVLLGRSFRGYRSKIVL
jgi:hypothetical protein